LDGLPLKTLTSEDNEGGVTLQPGDLFQIRLPENPTTGYSWQLADWDQAVATKTRDQFLPSGSMELGAGGHHVWEFIANAPGKTMLRLENRRSWERSSTAQSFLLTVLVT
jgi:inhibitor of cysteine peptidase